MAKQLMTCAVLWSALFGCGEFRTERFYVAPDTPDVPVDTPNICETYDEIEIVTLELPTGNRHSPYVAPLQSDPPGPVQWRLVSGRLPGGMDLDPSTGLLAGVPDEAGLFHFSVEAFPDPSAVTCTAGTYRDFSLTIELECDSSRPCPEQESLLEGSPSCVDGVCSLPADECPVATGSAGLLWNASQLSDGPSQWVISGHHKLTSLEQSPKEPFGHVLLLDGGGKTAQLAYTLPDRLPLPYNVGDKLQAAVFEAPGFLPGKTLALESSGGDRLVFLFEGLVSGDSGDPLCPLTNCAFSLNRWPLQCPGQWVPECGTAGPDAITVTLSDSTAGAAHTDLPLDVELPGGLTRVFVSQAYSFASFDALECRGDMPMWASLFFYPLDSCPIARISVAQAPAPRGPSTKPTCVLKQSFTGHMVECRLRDAHDSLPFASFIGAESFSLAGHAMTQRKWTLEQPVPDLISLYPKGAALQAQVLYPPVCGDYRVALEVVDAAGQSSCVDDVMEVRVVPGADYDLRVELTWLQGDGLDARLLLMYPQFTQSWNSEKWICSRDNSSTPSWSLNSDEKLDQVCHLAAGNMTKGVPEVLTVEQLRQEDKPVNLPPYKLGILAPQSNEGPVSVTVRVYLGGVFEPAYERVDRAIEPGMIWSPGGVSSKYMSFIPASQPYEE